VSYLALASIVVIGGGVVGLSFWMLRSGASAMASKVKDADLEAASRIKAAIERSSSNIAELQTHLERGGKL